MRMNSNVTRTGRGFPRIIWDQITRNVTEFIETESLVIHPDYREAAIVAIRYVSGETVFVGKTPEEARAIADKIARFWGLSVHDLAQARARAYALSIAKVALEKRTDAFARAQEGYVPKPAYANPNPEPKITRHSHKPRLRVV